MLKNKSFLAIIPAREGSKRLPNKNLLNFSNKPLISWTISSSLNSKYIDKTLVSTDSKLIKKTAIEFGAEVPFLRPDKLSTDHASRDEVIRHSIDFLKTQLHENFDYIVCLQPTSPLRDEIHIDRAIEYLFEKEADSVISVCEVEHPIEWTGILPSDKKMQDFIQNKYLQTRSQDFPIRHRINGAIYICSAKKFLETSTVFLKENIFAYIMPRKDSIDIDEEFDFIIAESIFCNNL
jgi:CMP-N,N'-diacetyllegionaminic acid synthase